MTVYVDKGRYPFYNIKMCHLVADTLDELNEFAEKIGLYRDWLQTGHHGASLPHYDISLSKRKLAIEHGAVVINQLQLVELIRKFRSFKKE